MAAKEHEEKRERAFGVQESAGQGPSDARGQAEEREWQKPAMALSRSRADGAQSFTAS